MFQCPKCRQYNHHSSRFCEQCGNRLKSEPEIIYASFGHRAEAFFIDLIILFMLIVIVSIPFWKGNEISSWNLVFIIGISLFYFTILESFLQQATFGKKAAGIFVTDTQYQPIGFLRSLLRNLAKYVTIASIVGWLLPFFLPKKQTLHDLLTGTVLVTAESIICSYVSLPKKISKLNLNLCSEEQLAKLPGVGPILAKKAITIRDLRGKFNSMEEFEEAIGISPHVLKKLRPLLVFDKQKTDPKPKKETEGRLVDV